MTPQRKGRWYSDSSRTVSVAAAALLFAASLTGCGPADTGLRQDTARQLQERVLGVSQAAAGNDPAAALTALEALEDDLATATGNGTMSEDRRRTIVTAVAAVRADLQEAMAAALAAAAAAKSADDAAAAAQRQAEAQAAAAEAAKVAPAQGEGKNKEGKGKGKNDDD